jgi:putative flippase GtrA
VRGQLARYCAVGVANTLLSLAVDALLLAAGAPVLAAAASAFLAGACSGYALNRRFTFAARGSLGAGTVYGAVTLAGLGLDTALVHLLHGAGLAPLGAYAVALPLVTLATFAANRRLAFGRAGYA